MNTSKIKIFSFYTSFKNFGGAEKVLLNLHKYLKNEGFQCFISSFDTYNEAKKYLNVPSSEYMPFIDSLVKLDKDSICISHHRKITSILKLVSYLRKIELIHVAHNLFYTLKRFSLFPKNIIAVSEAVKKNHIEYFKIPEENIIVIYNGIKDALDANGSYYKIFDKNNVKIIYPARITPIKKQVEIIRTLKELPPNIKIYFAGRGEQENELLELARKFCSSYEYLGHIEDLPAKLPKYDFVMLFSEKEGLPVSLVEGIMFGKPCIARNVGGCSEVVIDNYNGFIVENFEDLQNVLKKISSLTEEEYIRLSKNARSLYLEKFTEEKMLEKYKNYILKILSTKENN